MYRKCCIGILLIGLLSLPAGYAGASEAEPDQTLSPYFFIENDDDTTDLFPLKATAVQVNISGVIAEVIVRQTYANEGLHPINGRYIFPASTRAAVHGMKMTVGQTVITARLKERHSARQTFTQAKAGGQSASLLEQQRPNVFSMRVANIMPADSIQIELRYSELLVPAEGSYQFVFPMVVGPRYAGRSSAVAPERQHRVKTPYLKQGELAPGSFDLQLTLSTGMSLQAVDCPSHAVNVTWEGPSLARVAVDASEALGGNRDFILNYRLAGSAIQTGLMLYEGQKENFFLLMAQPPQRVPQEAIPPREYLFVVDVSGSMHGFPLNTAKALLKNLIGCLEPSDRFNVILFAGSARVLGQTSLPASRSNISKALRLIDQQQGGGGTELRAALQKALRLPRLDACSRSVVVVTDGYIAAEREVFDLIRDHLDDTNVFAFGIGSSVNRYLIEGMAKAGQGEPFVVTRPEAAPAAAERFRSYIETPVLTRVDVAFRGWEAYDIEPPGIPDLFAQRPLIVMGKWRGDITGTVVVSGQNAEGPFTQAIEISALTPRQEHRALGHLWARGRIERLSDYHISKGNAANQAEITSLGLTYHLLTAYTAFVAVHEQVRNPAAEGMDVDQPLPLPLHVSNLAVGGTMSVVPEPGLGVLAGATGLLLATAWARRQRNKQVRR